MSRKRTEDLEKELVESDNWTRIDEIVKEIRQLYKRERNARAHRTNLLLGQKFLELRKLVTGTDEEFNPKSRLGRKWGRFVKSHLKGCGVSRATTYRCAQAWKAASAMVPEPVLTQLAEREEMIGVAVSGEKPLGKFTLAMESTVETEPDFESEEGVEVFIETVLGSPEKAKKSDPMQALYLKVIKGLVAIAKSKLGETMDGKKRELSVEMLRDPLYTLVSTVQRGIEMRGTHDYETATELPMGYGDWSEVSTPKTTGIANSKAKPKVQEPKIPAAKKTKTAKPVDEKKESPAANLPSVRPAGSATTEKKKIVHSPSPNRNRYTRCSKHIDGCEITADASQVTCHNCQTSIEAEERAEKYYAEHPEERGWHFWADSFHWRNHIDGRTITKTPRKKEYETFDKDGNSLGKVKTYEEAVALNEMNKVLDEGVAKRWMTTEPRKPTSPVAALERTLKEADAECIAVPDEEQNCDYSEDEVATMFAEGGK